jgi:hypothetical protein
MPSILHLAYQPAILSDYDRYSDPIANTDAHNPDSKGWIMGRFGYPRLSNPGHTQQSN